MVIKTPDDYVSIYELKTKLLYDRMVYKSTVLTVLYYTGTLMFTVKLLWIVSFRVLFLRFMT